MSINQHMILELDVGNSRIKWRLLAVGNLTVINAGHVSGLEELQRVTELEAAMTMARMCSVRGNDVNKKLEDWVRAKYRVDLVQAKVAQSCGGVTNQYADVSRLGIDRWLAMLAAYRRADGACMIIDSGTAFTIDVVDEQGLHLGGYIIPGLGLMHSSLESHTAIRLSDNYSAYSQSLGHSTDEAVFNGTVTALLATIEQQSESLGSASGVEIYFAGGDAELLHGLAGLECSEVVTSLVLDGLDVACPYPDSDRERA
ncbi:MAG: pantothenate kinase [SAR86 cluster bacterium]|uniref:Type III pantothenate kinase n=1 Tax=SAR86 cluster bacterium TaxID=2030880 RepID=A0A2A4XIT4_9GAMM|nr:MAG: pantothenate kinase [SAR86 cluster bacterium]